MGVRLRHHRSTTGVPPFRLTNPLNLRRSGCRLPTTGNCFPPRMRNLRFARVQEPLEPAEELHLGQKPLQALAEPLANPER